MVRIAPDDAEGHYYLGVALRLKGSSSDAHAEFLEALRLQPNNPQYPNMRSRASGRSAVRGGSSGRSETRRRLCIREHLHEQIHEQIFGGVRINSLKAGPF
jgi:hypothetical protein